jgi:hypothetical protein
MYGFFVTPKISLGICPVCNKHLLVPSFSLTPVKPECGCTQKPTDVGGRKPFFADAATLEKELQIRAFSETFYDALDFMDLTIALDDLVSELYLTLLSENVSTDVDAGLTTLRDLTKFTKKRKGGHVYEALIMRLVALMTFSRFLLLESPVLSKYFRQLVANNKVSSKSLQVALSTSEEGEDE